MQYSRAAILSFSNLGSHFETLSSTISNLKNMSLSIQYDNVALAIILYISILVSAGLLDCYCSKKTLSSRKNILRKPVDTLPQIVLYESNDIDSFLGYYYINHIVKNHTGYPVSSMRITEKVKTRFETDEKLKNLVRNKRVAIVGRNFSSEAVFEISVNSLSEFTNIYHGRRTVYDIFSKLPLSCRESWSEHGQNPQSENSAISRIMTDFQSKRLNHILCQLRNPTLSEIDSFVSNFNRHMKAAESDMNYINLIMKRLKNSIETSNIGGVNFGFLNSSINKDVLARKLLETHDVAVVYHSNGKATRVSFRSREGGPVDVGEIARRHGGNGTACRAGAEFDFTMDITRVMKSPQPEKEDKSDENVFETNHC
jgi:hypothetical protein